MENSQQTRRTVVAGIAGGVALSATGVLNAAGSSSRTLVCVRLSSDSGVSAIAPIRGGLAVTSAKSREKFTLHPSLTGVRRLFDRSALALLQESGAGPLDRDYIKGGFSGPGWMTRAAQASVISGHGAYGFSSGLLALSPDAAGQSLDDPKMLAKAGSGNFSFPNTAIGKQLRQVAGLMSSGSAPKAFVASMGGAIAVGDAAVQIASQLQALSDAFEAFDEATHRIGNTINVTTFTDPDVEDAPNGARVRLVMGGGVVGRELYSLNRADVDTALGAWAGYQSSTAVPTFLY